MTPLRLRHAGCGRSGSAASQPQAAALPANVYFETGKSTLPADAKARSHAAADYAKAHPDAKFTLSGFTDATGSAARTPKLAKTRAQKPCAMR